jgi:NDP-sugar pyrophosphorylase family protein
MAAGEGRRLRPLTERWAKPLLPVDGRPVVGTLLRELAAAGCEEAVVVTGHLAQQVEELLGDGRAFGVPVRCVRQPGVLGSADAVLRAQVEPPYLVTAADTVYVPGDLRAFWDAFAAAGTDGAMAVRRDPPPSPPHRGAVRIEDGRVTRVLDDDPGNPFAGAPLWVLGPRLQPLLERLPGTEPWELATVFQEAVDAGLAVSGLEIGATRDLTRPEDLVERNFSYLTTYSEP